MGCIVAPFAEGCWREESLPAEKHLPFVDTSAIRLPLSESRVLLNIGVTFQAVFWSRPEARRVGLTSVPPGILSPHYCTYRVHRAYCGAKIPLHAVHVPRCEGDCLMTDLLLRDPHASARCSYRSWVGLRCTRWAVRRGHRYGVW